MKIVLASTNSGKLAEVRALLHPYSIEVISQEEASVPEIEETGLTFVENAILKARHAAKITGLPALADDSGLDVPALGGAPGIYSSRYSGKGSTSEENIKKLLTTMQGLEEDKRDASFYCVLAFMQHANDPAPLICDGRWSGFILKKTRGTHGFGYDPVFFDPLHDCSAAELPLDKKNKISHRGQAMQKFIKEFPRMVKGGHP